MQNNPVNSDDPLGLCGGDDAEPGFWDAVGSGLNVGVKATASAMSFGLYDGGDAKCDPDFAPSKKLAGVGRDALILAATVGAGGSAVAAEETGGVVEGATEGSEDIAETCLRCFTGETLVQMADGTAKPIRDVQVGDRVKSRDPVTGKESAKTVTATIKRLASSVVRVSVTDAKTGQSETLTCTPEHPLFVQGQGWVEAGSLGIGTSIVSRAGPALTVQSVTWQRETAGNVTAGNAGGSTEDAKPYTVYNLTVEDDHTYFVGSLGGGTWVHNVGCLDGKFADAAKRTDHFNRHGGDFGANTEDEYEQQASDFLNGRRNTTTLEKTRSNGDVVRYDPTTEEFGVGTPNGGVRTYYKPAPGGPPGHNYPTNLDYFNSQ